MDTLTKQHRSWNMSKIRSCDTAPERQVRSILHRLGFRFRKVSGMSLPGKPDIVLPRCNAVVLVHGCFWHRHQGCRYAYTPKSRIEFWNNKFIANVKRDKVVKTLLRRNGWRVITVWECELRDSELLSRRLETQLRDIAIVDNRNRAVGRAK